MRVIMFFLMLVYFAPQINACSVAVDAPPVEKKEAKKKINGKKKVQSNKKANTALILSITGLGLVVIGAIWVIYGAVATLATLSLVGYVFMILGLMFCLIALIVYYGGKKSGMEGEEKKKEKKSDGGMGGE